MAFSDVKQPLQIAMFVRPLVFFLSAVEKMNDFQPCHLGWEGVREKVVDRDASTPNTKLQSHVCVLHSQQQHLKQQQQQHHDGQQVLQVGFLEFLLQLKMYQTVIGRATSLLPGRSVC